jgi:hypothetical protein
MESKYSFLIGLRKTAVNTALITAPMLINLLPQEWLNLTLGAALYMVLNFLKVKWSEGELKGVN